MIKIKLLNGILSLLIIFVFSCLIGITAFKNQRNYVDLSKVNDEVIFFYKDDCPDCNKVFNRMVWRKITGENIIFVNMNNRKNRKYIKDYSFRRVPTIYEGK